MVMVNRRDIIDEVTPLQISHGSADQITNDELSLHKVCASWLQGSLPQSTSANVLKSLNVHSITTMRVKNVLTE